jgi:hypothetical protein
MYPAGNLPEFTPMRELTEDEKLKVEELLAEDLLLGGEFDEIARAVGVDVAERDPTPEEIIAISEEHARLHRARFTALVLRAAA